MVLREADYLPSAMDRHCQFLDPSGEDALNVGLRERKQIIVPRREIADIEREPGEARDMRRFSLREEPIGDAALIENFDRARVQTPCEPTIEFLAGAPLD